MKNKEPSIMQQKESLAELFKIVSARAQSLQALLSGLPVNINTLDELIKEYHTQRITLFRRELARKKLGWCTYGRHSQPIPLKELKLVLIQMFGEPDQISGSGKDTFKAVRICRQCMDELGKRPYPIAIFPTKEKNGELLFSKTKGVWHRVPEEAEIALEMPESAAFEFPALALELGIPGKAIALYAKVDIELFVGKEKTALHLERKLSRPEFRILDNKPIEN
jgi:hypothetical protein